MQPITPAIGGGRQRLLGLYHALGDDIQAVYLGSYDWSGESPRDQMLSPGLRERLVPLSDAHHAAAREMAARLGGRVVIDLAFADQVHLSPEFLDEARRHIADAHVVVFSHPWAYPPLRDAIRPGQLVVYDSQNVEAVLRASLHGDLAQAAGLLRRVAEVEYLLCREADLVLACSHEDREIFARVYDVDWSRLRVVPNGIFAFGDAQAPEPKPVRDPRTVVFVGSDYGPNNEAARFVVEVLAPQLPSVTFALIGSCCSTLGGHALPDNVRTLGVLDEETKRSWMQRATVAVNPLAAGSGTSIKMFDFMAAGLPSLTTAVGGRGIATAGGEAFVLAGLDQFATVLAGLLEDSERRQAIAEAGRRTVEALYAWERISPGLGRLLRKRLAEKERGTSTKFSVVIPTYERHALLDRLTEKLEAQAFRDFEVIIIDQSAARWPAADAVRPFPLTYVHSEVRGAVKARNQGGYLASGDMIAFTDDDCEPRPDWLANAVEYFEDDGVAGIEGLVCSDKLDDPDWRPVTNVGFEGIGFMTANLMVRNSIFQKLDGFDLAFDDPHFREDTDFGWRMQALGRVPYAREVKVYHPPHRRDIARESQAERNRFFEKDALLLRKHPERYRDLFLAEAHYAATAGFWQNFDRGLRKYGVPLPDWMADYR